MKRDLNKFFKAHGKRTGSKAGKAAAANMTEEQRIARARKAVAARVAKRAGETGVSHP